MHQRTLTFAAVIAAAGHVAVASPAVRARQEIDTIVTQVSTIYDSATEAAGSAQPTQPPAAGGVGDVTVPGGQSGLTESNFGTEATNVGTITPTVSPVSESDTMMGGAGAAESSSMMTSGSMMPSSTMSSMMMEGSNSSSTGSQVLPIVTDYMPEPYSYNQEPTINSARLSSEASYASIPIESIPGNTIPAQPVISTTVSNSNGPYSGTPTVTGAVGNQPLNTTIPMLPPNPTALRYNPNGTLNDPEPIPFQPAGGLGTNGTEPVYRVQSDFDYQSILLGLYQEWIELDLFHNILARFNETDFAELNLTKSDMYLIQFMADQETGHSTLLSNMLGGPGGATPMCTYNYPFETLHEALDFSQILTRWGESGVLGFRAHLDSREVAQMLDQSITTESRQQLLFRQMSGLFPMPVWFETGIPQSWAWTYLAPYISSCPPNSKRLAWQNFPELRILNQPNINRWNANATGFNETVGFGPAAPSREAADGDSCNNREEEGYNCDAAISNNRSIPLSYPGRDIFLQWEAPGKQVGPNNSYVTSTLAGEPKFACFVSQLNVTYAPLTNVSMGNGSVMTANVRQPGQYSNSKPKPGTNFFLDVQTFEGDPAINGTVFIALTDNDQVYTPFNLSMINPHVAALGLYHAG